MADKPVKIGVRRGGGPPPGFRWSVQILDLAYNEARGFLTEAQYQHMAAQVRELASESDPTHSQTQSVDAIEDFHELRDTGGILGGLNVRVFFLDKLNSDMVIIGCVSKQNNGPTPQGDTIRMRRRKRKYLSGDYG
jgi:phage-related protein